MGFAEQDFLNSTVEMKPIIHSANRTPVVLACTLLFAVLYGIPNHFPYFEPRFLSMTQLDAATPFVVGSVWVYFSAYSMIYITCYSLRELETLNRLIGTFITLALTSSFIFVLYPTTYPRAEFPLPADTSSWTVYFFSKLREADAPTNCAPSLHVALSYLSALPFFSEGRKKIGLAFLLWTLAVWVSTTTTKQHYWLDGLLGIVLVSVIYFFFEKKVRWQLNSKRN
jgi:hypothetical protein